VEKDVKDIYTDQEWEDYFQSIYTDYYPALCIFAKTFIYDIDESEEIVQGVVLKLWEQKESIKGIQSIKSYLYRAVRNTCLNYIKHQKLENRYRDSAWVELKKVESDFIDPYQNTELEEHLNSAIQELPDRCKEVFEMSRFDGLKNKEISDKLDISIKAVEANITRALSSLRKKIAIYLQSENV
jgi:RNA polymerase sigma-70 factor (ECF subfamily)